MFIGKRRETSYTSVERIEAFPYVREHSAQALYSAKNEVVLTLLLLDGSTITGFRVPKQRVMELEFLGVTESSPNLSKIELWAFSSPDKVRVAPYV